MFKAMLELDFKYSVEFSIEIPDRVLKGLKHSVGIYLAMTIEIDVQSSVGTGFNVCIEFSIEIPDRVLKGHSVRIYLAMTT